MALPTLGIDIAKKSYQVTLLQDGKRYHRSFRNQASEFAALDTWLGKHQVGQVHACMEATGIFWEALADHLFAAGHLVSVVNPARIRHYACSKLSRNKTDKLDGDLIADFCASQNPALWAPPAPEIRELRDRVRLLEDLQGIYVQETNRMSNEPSSSRVRQTLDAHLVFLQDQIEQLKADIQAWIDQHETLALQRDLLVTIPGIGPLTAAKLLSENIQSFPGTRAVVAYAGLNPRLRQSGTSLYAKPQLSKLGNANLRKALYFPAMSARRTNPLIKTFCDRLQGRGKVKMAVLGAAMRKLLCIAFGVLKSGKAFDPNYADKVPFTS